MTIRSIKEALALFGFTLHVTEHHITFVHKDIEVKVNRSLSRCPAEALLLNVPNWVDIVNEALSEGQKGGGSC